MWVLNNVTTKNAYEDGTTLNTGLARRIRVSVYNASVFRQVLTSPDGIRGNAQWQPETFLAPGTESLSLRGVFGIRVRSAVEGKPAQVTIQAFGPGE